MQLRPSLMAKRYENVTTLNPNQSCRTDSWQDVDFRDTKDACFSENLV